MMVDAEDLGGVAEVAQALSAPDHVVLPTNVTTWMSRRATNHCPDPIVPLRMGTLHSIKAWEHWYKNWRKP